VTFRKKLIEVALPLEAINEGSKPETENPFLKGHPRAVLFAQLIDDPGNDLTEDAAQTRRGELLEFVGRLATWEAGTDSSLIGQARAMWTAPDSLDTFLSGICLFLVVVRAKIAQTRVSPPAIVEQLDVLDNRGFRFSSGPKPPQVD